MQIVDVHLPVILIPTWLQLSLKRTNHHYLSIEIYLSIGVQTD